MSVFTMDQAAAAEITVVPGKQGAQAVHDVVRVPKRAAR
jgi:hypothetical protein